MEQIEFGSKVRVRLDPQTMDIRLETAFGRYASRAEFRPYFIYRNSGGACADAV